MIKYSRSIRCWVVDVPEGVIQCQTKADAREFLALYEKVGMKKAMKQLCCGCE